MGLVVPQGSTAESMVCRSVVICSIRGVALMLGTRASMLHKAIRVVCWYDSHILLAERADSGAWLVFTPGCELC